MSAVALAAPAVRRRGPSPLALLLRNRMGALGAALLLLEMVLALLAPVLAPADPLAQRTDLRLRPPFSSSDGVTYLLGTDQLGRDVLSRILFAGRVSLTVGFTAVVIQAPLGVAVGILAGYYSGLLDDVLMRLADIQLSFPFILLPIAVVGVLGPNLFNLVLVLGVSGWVLYARIVRGEVLSLREKEFVEAARALGLSDARILLRHLLPNVLTPVIVVATFAVGYVILLESSLSFVGLGVQPPSPTWGGMLSDSRDYVTQAWWLGTFPGLAIMLTVLGINFVGDWLRDLLDPRVQV